VHIQESVMAGLWRVQHLDNSGQLQWDGVEVGAIPNCVRELAFADAGTELNADSSALPSYVMNAPSLLVELDEKIRQGAAADGSAHVINLTLLPLNDADLMCLGERLGVGPVTLLSRGYGNCRIGSTACRDVWWIKYFNSEDSLILNAIEVVAVPEVALAAPEDIADSAHRLQEILGIYQ
jgi:hydrogenase-1 operon protein HyaF